MCMSERKRVHYRRQAILKPLSITGHDLPHRVFAEIALLSSPSLL